MARVKSAYIRTILVLGTLATLVMASGAPLWLLDEPLNGLDRDGTKRLDAAVAAHRNAGGAVLAASHLPLGGAWRQLELGL